MRAHLEAFLPHVGAPFPLPDPLPPDLQQGAEAFYSERRPDEAEIPLEPLPYPVLVVTGDHEPAFEAVADVLCARLGAERLVLRGAGTPCSARRVQRGARGIHRSAIVFGRASDGDLIAMHDAVVIGAGHNGLVAANVLADRAGRCSSSRRRTSPAARCAPAS